MKTTTKKYMDEDMAIDTNVKDLIINELTKAQYNAAVQEGLINDNELYMITDENYPTMDDLTNGFQPLINSSNKLSVANISGLATVATTGDYYNLTNKPTIPAAQVQSDWNATSGMGVILNKPTLSSVAASGEYNDLLNKPTIPAAQVQSDWNATSGMGVILNKPTIPTTVAELSDSSNYISISNTVEANTVRLANVAISGEYSDLVNIPNIKTSVDQETIDYNGDDELQVLGVINPRTNNTIRIWEGTEQQWNQGEATTWYNWQTTPTETWSSNTTANSRAWSTIVYGNNIYLMSGTTSLGYNGSFVGYSTDGINWTEKSMPSGFTYCELNSNNRQTIAFGNNKFVIFNNSSSTAYSTDGINWTVNSSAITNNYIEIKFVNDRFILNNGNNKIAYSTDGINWIEKSLSTDFSISGYYRDIAYGNGKYILTTSTNVYISSNFSDWQEINFGYQLASIGRIFYGDKFLLIGGYPNWYDRHIYYSIDGINWSVSDHSFTEIDAMNSYIAYTNGKYLLCTCHTDTGSTNNYSYSTDGINWTDSTFNYSDINIRSIIGINGIFLAACSGRYRAADNAYYGTTNQLVYSLSADECFTNTTTPTTSSTVYSAPNTASALTITSVGTGTITLSDSKTYNYNVNGNQSVYRSVGDVHNNWLCNIENVGVKIGNNVIATTGTSYNAGTGISITNNTISVDNTIATTASLANVATSGEYSDLLNKPTIPTVDQTYNASSANAQSGVAIEGMMSAKFQVVDSLPSNPTAGVFYFIKE